MLVRLLGEKTAQGPLQGPWAIADELLARAGQEWSLPDGDPYTPLIAACIVTQERPVPAAAGTTQKLLPASLPGSAQEKVTRRLAVVALFVALIGSALGLITKLVGWIATSPSWVIATLTAVVAFGIGVFASGRVADWFKKRH